MDSAVWDNSPNQKGSLGAMRCQDMAFEILCMTALPKPLPRLCDYAQLFWPSLTCLSGLVACKAHRSLERLPSKQAELWAAQAAPSKIEWKQSQKQLNPISARFKGIYIEEIKGAPAHLLSKHQGTRALLVIPPRSGVQIGFWILSELLMWRRLSGLVSLRMVGEFLETD